jgi:hypothetical protein
MSKECTDVLHNMLFFTLHIPPASDNISLMAEHHLLADHNETRKNPKLLLHTFSVGHLCDIW